MKGKYSFLDYFNNTYVQVPCEVVGESAKTYSIKLLALNVRGHRYGDVIRVQKRKVELERVAPTIDTSQFWYSNL